MTVRGLIFDFGGVLVRTINQAGREKWEKRLHLPVHGLSRAVFDSEAAALSTVGHASDSTVWEHVASSFHLSPAELEKLRRDFWAGDWLDTELIGFLSASRPAYKTVILSNAWSGARDIFTSKYHLDQVVDEIVISSEEGCAKPDPRIYQIALDRIGITAGEAIFVDDMPENVRAAAAVGMTGLQFRDTQQTIAEIRALIRIHAQIHLRQE